MAYTDTTLIEDYLQRDLTEHEVAYLPLLLPAIKRWIDNHLSSTFEEVTSTTRYYDINVAGNSLDIDPCTHITNIQAVDQYQTSLYVYQSWEYVQEPLNDTIKTELRLRGNIKWPHGTENLAITAQFSEWDGRIPEDIRIAATHIAGKVLQDASLNTGNIASESIEGHSLTYRDPDSSINSVAQTDPLIKSIMSQRQPLLVW